MPSLDNSCIESIRNSSMEKETDNQAGTFCAFLPESRERKSMKKENKIMKVYAATTQPGYKVVPQIRMQGEWLRELGFEPGDKITVSVSDEKIVVHKELSV